MSATNSTTTIGLSQYISTDKPTYLTDYNDDMLKIDSAIASDRDGISTAQNKANTADGKADANKTSIDTLNEQINGDPTATPPTTGIAGKVTTLESAVNSLSSLMGNGHPTTSDQTVIGAINNLEDTIAPSEDSSALGADYNTGKKFMRGGELYEALVDLTSGTAFSALSLNTDYKVADRLVKQIEDADSVIQTVNGKISNYKLIALHEGASVTADGVKTNGELITELLTAFNEKLATYTNGAFVEIIEALTPTGYLHPCSGSYTIGSLPHTYGTFGFTRQSEVDDYVYIRNMQRTATKSYYGMLSFAKATGVCTYSDDSAIVPASGGVFTIYFNIYADLSE